MNIRTFYWCSNPLRHTTPVWMEAVGGYESQIYRKTDRAMPLRDVALYLWFGTDHQMTEEQRLAYNIRQLGVTGAAEYERAETERRAKKKACK